jgi:hypothetical protein
MTAGVHLLYSSTLWLGTRSCDKHQENEWGYLEVQDAVKLGRQENLEFVLTTLVCVLEMNTRLYGSNASRAWSVLGIVGATVLSCSIM